MPSSAEKTRYRALKKVVRLIGTVGLLQNVALTLRERALQVFAEFDLNQSGKVETSELLELGKVPRDALACRNCRN